MPTQHSGPPLIDPNEIEPVDSDLGDDTDSTGDAITRTVDELRLESGSTPNDLVDSQARNPIEALASEWLERSRQAGHRGQSMSLSRHVGEPGQSLVGGRGASSKPTDIGETDAPNATGVNGADVAREIELAGADKETADELESLLPVIKRLESARKKHEQKPAGFATLGASRPKQLGDFRIIRQIGRGGMGVVFEAEQISLGRTVAIKVLPQSMLQDDRQVQRFRVEAQLAASLHHTNIVPVFGFGEDQEYHFYVMQRIDGAGLDRVRLAGKPMDVALVVQIGIQAAHALHYAHTQGVLHRDIKPANLLLDRDQKLWITDFGVAKAIGSMDQTRSNDVVGTLRYMAPEHFLDTATPRSDVYSLGLTLYELLAGRPAVNDATLRASMVRRQPMEPPAAIRKINPSVPKDLETILHKAMAMEESDRYFSAGDLAEDLERFVEGQPIRARRHSQLETLWRFAKRKPAEAALTALSTVLLFSVAVVATTGYFHSQKSLNEALMWRDAEFKTKRLGTNALNQFFQRFAGDDFISELAYSDTNADASIQSVPAVGAETAIILQDLLEYYDELANSKFVTFSRLKYDRSAKSMANDNLRKLAIAKLHIGGIHHRLNNHAQAANAYQLALADFRAFRLRTAAALTPRSAALEAELFNRMGRAYRALGDVDEAGKGFNSALRMNKGLPKNLAESAQCRFALARTYYLRAKRMLPGMSRDSMPDLRALSFGRFQGHAEQGPPGPDGFRDGGPPRNRSEDSGLQFPGRQPAGRQGRRPSGLLDSGPPREDFPRPGPFGIFPDGRFSETPEPPLESLLGPRSDPPFRRGLQHFNPMEQALLGMTRAESDADLALAREILEQLVDQNPDSTTYSLELARVLAEQSLDVLVAPDSDRAESARDSIAILQDLLRRYPDSVRVQWELIGVLSQTYVFHAQIRDHLKTGSERLSEAADLIGELVSQNPGIDAYLAKKAHVEFQLAVLKQVSGEQMDRRSRQQLDYAVSVGLRKTVEASSVLVRRNPDAIGYRAWHATYLMWLAHSLVRIGADSDAVSQFNESISNWKWVTQRSSDPVAEIGFDRAEQALVELLTQF